MNSRTDHIVLHRHFHMPSSIQKHTLVYTVVLGLLLTAFFDLSRIAALGIIFYLITEFFFLKSQSPEEPPEHSHSS